MLTLRRLIGTVVLVALLGGSACCEPAKLTHRWLFIFRDLTDTAKFTDTMSLLPRAQKAGYNAIVVSDKHLYQLDRASPAYIESLKLLQRTAAFYGMDLIPICMPMGYAGGLLDYDRNLAEGLPVKDALFAAHHGTLSLDADPPVAVTNGDFETASGDALPGWHYQMGIGLSAFADHNVAHTGGSSMRIERPLPGFSGVQQIVKVSPFRQYHLSVWVKTEGMNRPGAISFPITAAPRGRELNYAAVEIAATQDWTRYDIVFNSLEHDRVAIGAGVEGGRREENGRVWFDDVSLEEIGLMNVLRRPGCPLTVRGENGVAYEEGRDFDEIRDPLLDPYDLYHQPPIVRLTPNSRIKEGERVRVSYYHPVRIYTDQVVGCLSEPVIYDLQRAQVKRIDDLLHPKAFFMQHDEIRVANWDEVCQSRGLTPGQLLADNVRRCVQIIRDVNPEAKVWVWSDMFDPMHNAVDGYHLVHGTWEGSWEGLTSDIGIVNWAGFLEGRNCKWFADRGHEQVLAGYYDWDDEGEGIAAWLKATEGVPGITGAMYTPWRERYDAIEAWAGKAWGRPE